MKLNFEACQELIEECKSGNQIAFKQIFHMYRSYAYNLIYKITGARGEHEDLLQEVFFQIYLSLNTFQGESSFKTWFHRVVINTCTAHWRRQQAAKRINPNQLTSTEELDYELPNKGINHAKSLELKNLVEKALNTLDDKLRVPIVLNIYSELDLNEIAGILGIPEGSVKSRLFTARKRIREYLDSIDER